MLQDLYRTLKGLGGIRISVDILPSDSRVIVRSRGLSEAGLCDVEIADCPPDLQDVAKNLVLQVARNGRGAPDTLKEGKTIGGRFVRPDQHLMEAFRLERGDATSSTLRMVDLESNDGVFPRRLIGTHLCATAAASPRDQLRLLFVAIEVWPKEKVASDALLGDYEFNPNNFWSWIDLGTVLSESGQINEAIGYWKTAVCLWPRGGKMYAARERERANAPQGNSPRAAADFWRSVTNDAIQSWARELAVELPESVLAD